MTATPAVTMSSSDMIQRKPRNSERTLLTSGLRFPFVYSGVLHELSYFLGEVMTYMAGCSDDI